MAAFRKAYKLEEAYLQHSLGKAAENATCKHLIKQGLKLIQKNYDSNFGEIDLIMKDGDIYVFVEVRLRNPNDFTTGLESVTKSKQSKIKKTATAYLLEKNLWNKVYCRFDVVGVVENDHGFDFDWIENAFY